MPDPWFEHTPPEDSAFGNPTREKRAVVDSSGENGSTEYRRPAEWLRCLEAEVGGLSRLVQESGSLSIAAQRLARARLGGPPSFRQLRCVAMELAERTGYYDRIPGRYDMAVECLQQGLGPRPAART